MALHPPMKEDASGKLVPMTAIPLPPQQAAFARDLDKVLNRFRDLLIEKNHKYGDAVLSPKRVFSRADTIEQIRVRMDDKISRIMQGSVNDQEDSYCDLLGYLIMHEIAKLRIHTEKHGWNPAG